MRVTPSGTVEMGVHESNLHVWADGHQPASAPLILRGENSGRMLGRVIFNGQDGANTPRSFRLLTVSQWLSRNSEIL